MSEQVAFDRVKRYVSLRAVILDSRAEVVIFQFDSKIQFGSSNAKRRFSSGMGWN